MLGMLSPASRGALMTAAIFLFVFMGYVGIMLITLILTCTIVLDKKYLCHYRKCLRHSRMVSGYYSARLYKTLKGLEWKKAAFQTAILYPGLVFGISFFLNFFIWGKHSSGAVRRNDLDGLFSPITCET